MDEEPILRLENVHKWFGKVHAVNDVNLSVRKNEVIGLIGDNGAGKSTLIKIISGVISPTRGTIYSGGEPVRIPDVRAARDLGIETVHQDQAVAEDRSVAENIFMGREPVHSLGPLRVLDKKTMRETSRRLTRELGLEISSPDQEVRFCSGGERQGVAIARAMHFRANLVILDEPTTALSVKGRNKVLQLVEKMKRDGISILFITHNINHVYPVADRFVVMAKGEIVENINKRDITRDEVEELLGQIGETSTEPW